MSNSNENMEDRGTVIPFRLIGILLLALFTAEIFIHLLGSYFPAMSLLTETMFDATVVATVVGSILYRARAKYAAFISPQRIIPFIVLVIFVSETLVMIILSLLPEMSWLPNAIIDSSVLIFLLAPAAYLLQKNWTKRRSILQVISIIIIAIFSAEAFIMLLLANIPKLSTGFETLFDSFLLVLLVSPVLYIFLYDYVDELKKAEKKGKELGHDMGERVKELNCLYGISKLTSLPDITLEEIFRKTVNLVIPSWQYPEVTCSRIIFNNQEFKTGNFSETEWKQSADILETDKKVGCIEVFYLEEKPEIVEGPFLKEERDLLDSLAFQLGTIVERKHAEEALKESEGKLRKITSSVNEAIIMLDENGKVTFWNTTAERIFGYSSDEILNTPLHESIIPHEFRESHKKGFESFINTGHGSVMGKTLELAGLRKTGEQVPIELSLSAIKAKGGWRTIGVIRDITDRKLADKVVRERQDLIASIINIIPYKVFWKDKDSVYLGCNEEFAGVAGLDKPDDIIGKTDYDMPWKKEETEFYRKVDREVMESGVSQLNIEEPIRQADGTDAFLLTSKVPLRDAKGNVIGILGIFTDITELKNNEERLLKSEESLKKAQEIANIGNWEWNIITNEYYLSDETFQILGRTPQEYIPSFETYLSIVHPSDRDLVKDSLNAALNKSKQYDNEHRIVLTDGTERIVHEQAEVAFNEEGKAVRIVGTIQDITERKLLESQLTQAQKLESIGGLAAGIAHEINTPTQFIGDNILFLKDAYAHYQVLFEKFEQLLEKNKSGSIPDSLIVDIEKGTEEADIEYLREEIPNAIEAALRGVERVATIVRAMKEFSHPGTKEKVPTDINKAIDSTITVSRTEWKYVAEMTTEFDESLPLVPCLPGDFNQLILNMITNAAHAISEANGDGPVQKGAIKIITSKDGDYAVIKISDTGVGIPDAIKNKIFNPFFTTKEVGKGTGQGLAISHQVVVEKHGGSISFETEVGKGTKFVIRLPLTEKSSKHG
jgi:PAS domain S-box-containing protein